MAGWTVTGVTSRAASVWWTCVIKHLFQDLDNPTDADARAVGAQIAKVLRSSSWLKVDQRDAEARLGESEVAMCAEEFEDIEDLNHFSAVIDRLYDLADADRVWVA